MSRIIPFFSFMILILACSYRASSQESEISRIEFNSGSRTFREQIIVTPDSLLMITEDFRIDLKPSVKTRAVHRKEWDALITSLKDVRLTEIETLQSPTMKRTYDAAAHGSLIITGSNGQSYTHGFDDEDPHRKFRPLMEQIRKIRKK
jgi:hypothetical protein